MILYSPLSHSLFLPARRYFCRGAVEGGCQDGGDWSRNLTWPVVRQRRLRSVDEGATGEDNEGGARLNERR